MSKELSKEEILRRNVGLIPMAKLSESHKSIFAAMDECAKQEAIGFAEWIQQNVEDLDNTDIDELYNLCFKSKNK